MIPDNSCGERRNNMLRVRLTPGETDRWSDFAKTCGKDSLSDMVRTAVDKYMGIVQAGRGEIQSAIEKVKRGYQGVTQRAGQYIPNYEPEPAYLRASNYSFGY